MRSVQSYDVLFYKSNVGTRGEEGGEGRFNLIFMYPNNVTYGPDARAFVLQISSLSRIDGCQANA
jgi:hypothetical protein